MRLRLPVALAVCLFLYGPVIGSAPTSPLEQQRERFIAAYERLERGRPVDVGKEREALGGYPLAPYLTYRDLLNRLADARPAEVLAFLEHNEGLPVTALLRDRWLRTLGSRGRWDTFLMVDNGQGGTEIACYRLRAQRDRNGVDDDWLEAARALWTVGYSQPNACDPVFAELYDRDALSAEQRWQRMERIMQAGNTGLARALRGRLNDDDAALLDRWLEMAANPAEVLAGSPPDASSRRGRTIVLDGFYRLLGRDRDRARMLLSRFEADGNLPEDDIARLRREIALRAAYSRDPMAVALLKRLPDSVRDARVREWTARLHVGRQDWHAVIQAVSNMSGSAQAESEWRYWLGHALLETGELGRAEELLEGLAAERHYYGFLAADLLGRPYAMNHRPTPVDEARMEQLATRPGLVRAREWLELGFEVEARREWHAALAGASSGDWGQAAWLAREWNWYDRSVDAANRAGLHDDLELRFPLAYREMIEAYSRREGVDPALAFALIRKESAFNVRARSPAGALGLMQVMPGTGRAVARRHGLDNGDLLSPETNLRLGNLYLAEMLTRFEGNMILAGAAFNAGPSPAERWRSVNPGLPAAVWIENITYGETRDYVKSLLAFRAVFDWQLNGQARRLAAVMPMMPGTSQVLDVALGDGVDRP